jgi:hypothetical protein
VPAADSPRSPRPVWGLLGFFAVGLIGILRHEMWRDEIQAWTIATSASSLSELAVNRQYEGHPPGWHLLLYGLSRFTNDPISMQFAHLLIATLAVAVFVKYSSLPVRLRWLFVFGYFPLYEYCVISRCYGLGMLCLFLFCAVYSKPERRHWWLFGLLFAMAQTSFPVAALALLLGAFLLTEFVLAGRFRDTVLAAALYAATVGAVYWAMQIPPDTLHSAPDWHLSFSGSRIYEVLDHVFFTYLIGMKATRFSGLGGLLLILFFAATFLRRPRLLLLYLCGTFGLLTIFYIKYGARWHAGFLFLWLIVCLWLQDSFQRESVGSSRLKSLVCRAEQWQMPFVTLLLVCHLFTGWFHLLGDWARPFSGSKQAAQAIREAGLQDRLLIAQCDVFASPLSGYLDRELYYPHLGSFGSFIKWNTKRSPDHVPLGDLLPISKELIRLKQRNAVLVLHEEVPEPLPEGLEFLVRAEGGWGESYYLYKYDAKPE